jgi:hypothetical protein
MQNASDEHQAEANLREERTMAEALVLAYSEPIVILNAEMVVINATASFTQYFGLDKQTLVGKYFYEIADDRLNMSGSGLLFVSCNHFFVNGLQLFGTICQLLFHLLAFGNVPCCSRDSYDLSGLIKYRY